MRTHSFGRTVLTIAPLALLVSCGGPPRSTASKSAAAYDQDPAQGQRGHEHGGHGVAPRTASTPAAPAAHDGHGVAPPQPAPEGHVHGTAHSAAAHRSSGPVRSEARAGRHHAHTTGDGHQAHTAAAATAPATGHAHHEMRSGAEPASEVPHAGHTHTTAQPPAVSGASPAGAPAGHGGHGAVASRGVRSTPARPAAVLQPDALDAPAQTSVEDAARAAAMAEQMAGGAHHMSHGSYTHVDAGRVPATSPVHRESSASSPSSHSGHGEAPRPKENQ